MRYFPVSCLRAGMRLGETLCDAEGEPAFEISAKLTEDGICEIKRLGYKIVRVDHDASRLTPMLELLSEHLKARTLEAVRQHFAAPLAAQRSDEDIRDKSRLEALENKLGGLIDEIFENRGLMLKFADLKNFDADSWFHSVNVAVISIVLGIEARLDDDTLFALGIAALFHDIGKLFIGREILRKRERLTPLERAEFERHVELGAAWLGMGRGLPEKSIPGILAHHERYDGGGYPAGLSGEAIPLTARVISLGDAYVALTVGEKNKAPMHPGYAAEYIMAEAGRAFDPELANVLLRCAVPYPIGSRVRISGGFEGAVVKNYRDVCLRPCVRVLKQNGMPVRPFLLDLTERANLKYVIVP